MKLFTLFIIAGVMSSTAALAQTSPDLERKIVAEKIQTELRQAIGYSFDSKSVKGAPYAASAENESTQILADGNRIHSKSVTQVFRDNQGRTRREFQGKNGGPAQIYISDPVSGQNYTLDPAQRVAVKREVNQYVLASDLAPKVVAGVKLEAQATFEKDRSLAEPMFVTSDAPLVARKMTAEKEAQERLVVGTQLPRIESSALSPAVAGDILYTVKADNMESLGKQMIEGVLCDGKRNTITIPANSIGNDLPIKIVNEEWYSPELQVLVLTRHSDPRFGETVYRLTGIVKGEQPRDLFEAPSDYTVRDLSKPVQTRRIKEEQ